MESPSLMMQAPRLQAQPRIPSSVFEGLFVRGLQAEPRLLQALAAEGYERCCPELDYPLEVWKRCVSLARERVYADLGDAEAHRALGRKLAEGFSETLVGRVAAVALPMIGPARVVERLPRYLAMMGRPDVDVRILPQGERSRLVLLSELLHRPELLVGALEVALERAHARPCISVEEHSSSGTRLQVRW